MSWKIKIERTSMGYEIYKKSPLWEIIERNLHDLEDNGDIEITTVDELVIGYLAKHIEEACALCVHCKLPLKSEYIVWDNGVSHIACLPKDKLVLLKKGEE